MGALPNAALSTGSRGRLGDDFAPDAPHYVLDFDQSFFGYDNDEVRIGEKSLGDRRVDVAPCDRACLPFKLYSFFRYEETEPELRGVRVRRIAWNCDRACEHELVYCVIPVKGVFLPFSFLVEPNDV